MWRCALVLLASGCRALLGFEDVTAIGADATGDGCMSFSTQIDTCALDFGPPLAIDNDATFDTDTGMLQAGNVPIAVTAQSLMLADGEVSVLAVEGIRIGASVVVRATGMRPLVLIASSEIVLEPKARIDVAAGGAGARTSCLVGAQPGTDRDGGASGGGGGGFQGAGGIGGVGNIDGAAAIGGVGGLPSLMPTLLGGCPGAAGGNDNNDLGGAGGAGGGAVLLIARDAIQIGGEAAIDAGGAGGSGGEQHGIFNGDAGGGGGGSGGMISIEASQIRVEGILSANGGGGEGSGDRPGSPGAIGTARAIGGAGGSATGGDGGLGGAGTELAGGGVVGDSTGGGGGGGGGVGFIRLLSLDMQMTAGTVSPPPT